MVYPLILYFLKLNQRLDIRARIVKNIIKGTIAHCCSGYSKLRQYSTPSAMTTIRIIAIDILVKKLTI